MYIDVVNFLKLLLSFSVGYANAYWKINYGKNVYYLVPFGFLSQYYCLDISVISNLFSTLVWVVSSCTAAIYFIIVSK